MKGAEDVGKTSDCGYLRIANEGDRAEVANILYRNGYTVRPVRFKKDGKSYEYFVKYEKLPLDDAEGGDANATG